MCHQAKAKRVYLGSTLLLKWTGGAGHSGEPRSGHEIDVEVEAEHVLVSLVERADLHDELGLRYFLWQSNGLGDSIISGLNGALD